MTPAGRPPRDREREAREAEEAFDAYQARGTHRLRKLFAPEADLLHRTFGQHPDDYDDWEYELH